MSDKKGNSIDIEKYVNAIMSDKKGNSIEIEKYLNAFMSVRRETYNNVAYHTKLKYSPGNKNFVLMKFHRSN